MLTACGPTRVIKTLEKGEKQVSANLGGPVIKFAGAPIPLPLTSVNYQHGIDTGITVSSSLYTTDLLFGTVHLEANLGIKTFENKKKSFGLTSTPGIHLFYDFNESNFRAYPQIDLTTWWQYGEKPNLLFGGIGSWVELRKEKAYGELQTNELMPYISVGHQFNRPKWAFLTELKYIGFPYDNRWGVVDYIGPSHYGALGFYFGVSRRFVK